MSESNEAGGNIVPPPPGQPAVADLISNGTLLVADVSPSLTSVSDNPIDAPTLEKLAKELGKLGGIKLNVDLTDISFNDADGSIAKADVEASMRYGGDPARVMDDFSLPALTAKVSAGGEGVQGLLLLRQRMLVQVLSQFMSRLSSGDFDDPAKRKAMLATIDTEIARVERLVQDQVDAEVVERAGGLV